MPHSLSADSVRAGSWSPIEPIPTQATSVDTQAAGSAATAHRGARRRRLCDAEHATVQGYARLTCELAAPRHGDNQPQSATQPRAASRQQPTHLARAARALSRRRHQATTSARQRTSEEANRQGEAHGGSLIHFHKVVLTRRIKICKTRSPYSPFNVALQLQHFQTTKT